MENSYDEALKRLSSYSKQGAPVKDLSRFSALTEALSIPLSALRFIHIAGTNGKGSVAEYTARALTECGVRTGRFTSPFIIDIRERITLDGEFISEEDFARHIMRAVRAAEGCADKSFSQFEILTAAAFLYFIERGADLCVLEAGIGGTLDCTNVIPCPDAAVITSIGLDHTAILGGTEEEIARSKSGIIKGGNVVAASGIPQPAMAVIRERCERTGARLVIPDEGAAKVLECGASGSRFTYKGTEYRVSMCGRHQITNCLTAIEALSALGGSVSGIPLDAEKIRRGLEKAFLPARMERIERIGRLTGAISRPEIILDGGHNPQAAAAAREILAADPRKKTALIGMVDTKDWKTALRILLPCFERAVFYDGFARNAVNAATLCAEGRGLVSECFFAHDKKTALATAFDLTERDDLLFIGGSLYMASELRAELIGENA